MQKEKTVRLGKITKVFCVFCLGVVVAFFGIVRAAEPEYKTVAAVSFAGYDALRDSVVKIADLAGYKDTVVTFEMMFAQIEGFDKTKPIGAVVLTDGKEFVPFAFLPVAKLDDLQFPGIDEFKEAYDAETGVLTLGDTEDEESKKVELLERDGWLFVTAVGMKDKIPNGDPVALLGGLEKEYLAGGTLNAENISASLVDTLMALLRQKLASLGDETAEALDSLPAAFDYLLESIRTMSGGLAIDLAAGDTRFVCDYTVKAGSPMQKMLEMNVSRTTRWSDFCQREGSVFAFRTSEISGDTEKELALKQTDTSMANVIDRLPEMLDDEDSAAEMKAVLEKLTDVQKKTIERGRADYAASLTNDGLLMFGGDIGGGESLIEAFALLKDYIAKRADEDTLALFKNTIINNEEKASGYTVSTFLLSEETQEAFAQIAPQLAEKSLAVLLGVKEDAVILLAGLDKKRISDTFLKLAAAERSEAPLEGEDGLFSLPQVGALLETIVPEDSAGSMADVFATLKNGPADAICLCESEITKESASATMTIRGPVYALIGETVRATMAASESGDDSTDDGDLFEEETDDAAEEEDK